MDSCERGFSFMPETKVEVAGLQYIEGSELEHTWKMNRRQRLKEQEQKVWEEFVNEQDVVKAVCKDDPYQFLNQLPEHCLKELMETELHKARKEMEDLNKEQPNKGEGDFQREEALTVTFEDEADSDIFHIFDDKDDHSGPSGPEDEVLVSSPDSPSTVRERTENSSPEPMYEKTYKTSENVSKMIESSIYCAKVKDLRLKIHDEIVAVMASLDVQDVMTIERDEVSRMCRRSAEFCTRFNRIYMYQLQRQMQDVKRNTLNALPFAKHTHFHSQMIRVASLHQNLLQAFQVFHKSMEQTACVKESAAVLHSLALAAREVSTHCAAVPAPSGLSAGATLYNDEMYAICDNLDEAVCQHSLRVSDFLSTTDSSSKKNSTKGKGKGKMHALSSSSKSGTDRRLSMYSLDTLRINLNSKSSKEHSSATSKYRGSHGSGKPTSSPKKSPKSPRKSPRSRRPLMRAGDGGGARRSRAPVDADITTMVEGVQMCTSSHMSREESPQNTPRAAPASGRRTNNSTPRDRGGVNPTPRKSNPNTPRHKLRTSPKTKRHSPKRSPIVKAVSSIQSDPLDTDCPHVQITPLSQIQCTKKNKSKPDKSADKSKLITKLDKNIASAKTTENTDNKNMKVEKKSDNENNNKDVKKSNKVDRTEKIDKSFEKMDKDYRVIKSRGIDSKEDVNKDSPRDQKDFDSAKATASSSRGRSGTVDSRGNWEDPDGSWSSRERWGSSIAPSQQHGDVTMLLKQLCSGDAASRCRSERVSGARNAQLLCVSGGASPRQPSTPQLLRILEETIQKKAPKPMYPSPALNVDQFRLTFSPMPRVAAGIMQYRTRFVQHMLASSLYANSAVGKPWEMIGSVSEKIIDELLVRCAKEMQIGDVIQELYNCETN